MRLMFYQTASKHQKTWNVSGKSVSKSNSFSTFGWNSGTYYYALWVKDNSGNVREYNGSFFLKSVIKSYTANQTSITNDR